MDEETRRIGRAEVEHYNGWVNEVVPIIQEAQRDDDQNPKIKRDRTESLMVFTMGIFQNAARKSKDEREPYDVVLGRLCAALFTLAETQEQLDTLMQLVDGGHRVPADPNR